MIVGARIMFDRRATVLPGYTPSDIQKVDRTVPKHESSLQAMRRITYAPVRCVVVFVQQRFEGGWLDLCQDRAFVGETPLRTCWIAVPGSARVSRLHIYIYAAPEASGDKGWADHASTLPRATTATPNTGSTLTGCGTRLRTRSTETGTLRRTLAEGHGPGRMQRDRRSQRSAAGPGPRDRTRCTGATPRRAA